MARLVQRLTENKIRALTKIGLHHDGAGLYLQIRPGGARSWIYRFRLNNRTRDMGLGALTEVSLVKARDKAAAARALVNDGIDPIEHTRAQAIIPAAPKRHSAPTFEEVAEAYMSDRLKRVRNELHRDQWAQTLRDYAYPVIGLMPVDRIETNDVLAVLKPHWESKCETMARLRGRIERIAEIHQHAIAHVFRNETVEPCDGAGNTAVVSSNDLAQILRIEARGKRGRTDEITEHHGDLTAFGRFLGFRFRPGSERFRCCRSGAGQLAYSCKHFPPIPEEDPDVFEVLIGQIWKYRNINLVFDKAPRVLGHAELFEPIHNLLHRLARADLAETQKLELINSAQGVVAAFHSGRMSALGQKQTLTSV